MAFKKSRKPRKKSSSKSVVVIGKKTRAPRRSSVGATKKSKPRRKGRGVGFVNMNSLKQIGTMAIGVAGGAAISKFVIAPLNGKLVERFPMAAKFLAFGEILLGGIITMKAKHPAAKGVGFGILASGVNKAIDQTDAYKKLGIAGPADDYQTIRIPISGELDTMIAGILTDGRRNVATNMVAGMDRTNWIADSNNMDHTNIVAETELDNVFTYPIAKGVF